MITIMDATAPGLMPSLFHEPWWLDAAASNGWEEVSLRAGGKTIARLPFVTKKIGGTPALSMPPLTRTLGPQFLTDGKPETLAREQRRLSDELIALLPPHGSFSQIFDPRISESIAFYANGYNSALQYTIRIAAGTTLPELWAGIRKSMRQAIRKTEKLFTVGTLDIEEFCAFHNRQVKSNHRVWWSDPFARRADQAKIRVYAAAFARDAARLLAARDAQGNLRAAILLVWGHGVMYYLLTARDGSQEASGGVKLLVWEAMKLAQAQNLAFDFDGFYRPSAVNFQTGFGGEVCNRISVTKTAPVHMFGRAVISRLRLGL